jgi:hypothetical protein
MIQFVAEVTYREHLQRYWVADSTGGTFGTGRGSEHLLPESSESGSYKPVWIRIDELANLPVRRERSLSSLRVQCMKGGQENRSRSSTRECDNAA